MIQLDVTIMGQPYKLTCKEGEQETLQLAVAYLDERMCAIRDTGKVKGNDRIAVMASLGIAAEMLLVKAPAGPFSDLNLSQVRQSISVMHTVLDDALTPQENLF